VIEAFDPASGWRIRAADGGDPQTVPFEGLQHAYRTAPEPKLATGSGWQIVLNNGDRISGIEITLNDQNALLAGSASGLLTVPRTALRGLRNLAAWPVYEGPRIGEIWDGAERPLVAGEFALRLPEGEALRRRFQDLPRRLHLQLKTAPAGDFTVVLPAGDTARNDAAYVLQRAHGRWTLYRSVPGVETAEIRKEGIKSFPDAATAAVALWDFFTDVEERRVWLFCDGQMVCDWREETDEDTPPIRAAGTEIVVQAADTALEIRRFRVAPWRSGWPMPEQSDGPVAKDSDALLLANGDLIQGELRSWQAGKLILQTPTLPMTIPATRIAALTFHRAEDLVSTAPGSVRLILFNGDIITLRPTGIAGVDLLGEHPIFGPFRVALAEIRLLEQPSADRGSAP